MMRGRLREGKWPDSAPRAGWYYTSGPSLHSDVPTMQDHQDPDWDVPLTLTLTPAMLIHSLFAQAQQVHTGDESCISAEFVVHELIAVDERNGNRARLVEQEYVEEEGDDTLWHDWAVELRIGAVLITAHWQQPMHASPMEWEWCARQAEQAFSRACVLFGKQVRPGLVVLDEFPSPSPESSVRRH